LLVRLVLDLGLFPREAFMLRAKITKFRLSGCVDCPRLLKALLNLRELRLAR
jgi:hypothetical protein